MRILDQVRLHKNSSKEFIKKAEKLAYHDIVGSKSDLAKKIRKKAREVMGEYHRLSAFLRFEAYPEMLLFTETELVHNTSSMLMNHFTKRYSTFVIAIYTNKTLFLDSKRDEINYFRRKYETKKQALGSIRKNLEDKIKDRINTDFWDLKYWDTFYNSQYISARKNLKLMGHFLPSKFVKQANMKVEKNLINKEKRAIKNTLDKYIS